ncbi:SDR family NAD(P)-dependent oxidoreductase [Streptomyces sp. CB01881]|uniref:SDR family NAD(P)-dependent oxidoreductase n=1 Tax=Streptomyces sp. CB01881 TaxID=2078691 RepID=UPI001F11BE9E|nr:SDR family NAD(P)-dependent oxidoreductase [Streptomyces sp. CB01881]
MTTLTPLELPIAALPLQGRVALVTGGATGIGAAIARALAAAAGACVAVNHLSQIRQARTVLADVRRGGRGGIEVSADLADSNAVAALVSQVESELGPVDVLINNAGVYPRIPWDELGEDEWARAIESNLTIHYRTCRAITPGMADRRWGRIVNIGSVNARAGRPGLAAYSAAKAGLLGLTRSLARELGPAGICVNTVVPGAIQVEAENDLPAHHRARPEDQICRQRVLHHRPVVARRRRLAPPLTRPTLPRPPRGKRSPCSTASAPSSSPRTTPCC